MTDNQFNALLMLIISIIRNAKTKRDAINELNKLIK